MLRCLRVSEETVAKKKESRIPAETLATRPEIERKGDVHPYTSVNGHMFTYLDQSGILGIRLAHEEVDPFLKKYNTALFETYGVVKKDWVTVPDSLLRKARELQKYLDRSYEFTKTLKPK
jgi:hypothetical protein